jgi:hypothetical protein
MNARPTESSVLIRGNINCEDVFLGIELLDSIGSERSNSLSERFTNRSPRVSFPPASEATCPQPLDESIYRPQILLGKGSYAERMTTNKKRAWEGDLWFWRRINLARRSIGCIKVRIAS